MSRLDKLIAAVRNNPKDVRYADACWLAEQMGFSGKGQGGGTSHQAFSRPGEPALLNFQKQKGGKIKPYQARQLIDMIDKYEDV